MDNVYVYKLKICMIYKYYEYNKLRYSLMVDHIKIYMSQR